MLTFTSITDPQLARLPPPVRSIIINHLHTLRSFSHGEPDPEEDGFVGFVEPQDNPEIVESAVGRSLTQLEGVFQEGDFLIGVVLWGNAGAGVTLVCPQIGTHAVLIAEQLRQHLPNKESGNDRRE